jgi:hypothetical protein
MALEEFNHFFQESTNSSEININLLTAPSTINLLKKYRRHGLPFFYYNSDTRKEFGELPEDVVTSYFNLIKKLTRQRDISYDEYKKYFDVLCKVACIPNTSTIKEAPLLRTRSGTDNKPDTICKGDSTRTKLLYKNDTRLFHTSQNPNITALTPKFRSVDEDDEDGSFTTEALFPAPRIYFGYNAICTRIGGSVVIKSNDDIKRYLSNHTDTYVYEYTGPRELINGIYVDPELKGNAVFVETFKDLPVKLLKIEDFENNKGE